MNEREALSMVRALKLALEALEYLEEHLPFDWAFDELQSLAGKDDYRQSVKEARDLIPKIKEALAQPEPWEKFCDSNCVWTDHHPDCKLAEQKPVAWTLLLTGENNGLVGKAGKTFEGHPEYYRRVDVYTTPPQRKPLSNEEIKMMIPDGDEWKYGVGFSEAISFARAIEAAHGIIDPTELKE